MTYAPTLDFINSLNGIENLEHFEARYADFLDLFGFRYFVISGIPDDDARLEKLMVVDNLPQAWADEYQGRGYLKDDPIIRHCVETEAPFLWADVERSLTCPRQRAVLERAADYGLTHGVCIPIHGINGLDAGCSFSGAAAPLDVASIRALHLSALYAFNAARRIHSTSALRPEALTERECDVLRWCALGKTTPQIARAVSIAEHTVNTHVRNAMRKLSAANKTEAVATAIRLRMIAA